MNNLHFTSRAVMHLTCRARSTLSSSSQFHCVSGKPRQIDNMIYQRSDCKQWYIQTGRRGRRFIFKWTRKLIHVERNSREMMCKKTFSIASRCNQPTSTRVQSSFYSRRVRAMNKIWDKSEVTVHWYPQRRKGERHCVFFNWIGISKSSHYCCSESRKSPSRS